MHALTMERFPITEPCEILRRPEDCCPRQRGRSGTSTGMFRTAALAPITALSCIPSVRQRWPPGILRTNRGQT